ncbi:MAG: transferrin-binding protein-like solute binding protein, partial [Desulfobacterales bacterium]|nr:transferrin-binding protein-like solute binding protein [Desulfobacterales bacterium]
NIDFETQTVSGSIDFKGISLVLNSGYMNTSGFSAHIDNAVQSQVSGAFYGSNAQGVGGNFSAEINKTNYLGIFAADR